MPDNRVVYRLVAFVAAAAISAVITADDGAVIRQQINLDGTIETQVIIGGQDLSSRHGPALPKITEVSIAEFDLFAEHALRLARTLGENAVILQIERQIDRDNDGKSDYRRIISGYGSGTHGVAGNVSRSAVREVPENPTYIVAQYYATDAIDRQWLTDSQYRIAANLLTAIILTNALIWQEYDSSTRQPVGGAQTLRGFDIDIRLIPEDIGEYDFGYDSYPVIECLLGSPPTDIERTFISTLGVSVAAPITARECPNASWNGGGAGAPKALMTILTDADAQFILLEEITGIQPAEWRDVPSVDDDGQPFVLRAPVTERQMLSRRIKHSCLFSEYSETHSQVMPAKRNSRLYMINTVDITPLVEGANDFPDFRLDFGATVVHANLLTQPLKRKMGDDGAKITTDMSLHYRSRGDSSRFDRLRIAKETIDDENGVVLENAGEDDLPALEQDFYDGATARRLARERRGDENLAPGDVGTNGPPVLCENPRRNLFNVAGHFLAPGGAWNSGAFGHSSSNTCRREREPYVCNSRETCDTVPGWRTVGSRSSSYRTRHVGLYHDGRSPPSGLRASDRTYTHRKSYGCSSDDRSGGDRGGGDTGAGPL